MADKEIGGLTAATTPLAGMELLHLIQSANSRQVAASEIVKISHNQAWSTITSTPTTLSGYGITDAQALDSDLTAIAALDKTDGNFIVANGTAWTVESGATARTSLGLGTAATTAATDYATSAQGATADSALQPGDIGTTVQAQGATLDSLEGLTLASGDVLYATAADTLTNLAKGTEGQVLKVSATGVPEWGTVAGTGDMLAATYDPTSVAGDAFDMANMVEATDAKIMTAAERTKLAGIEAGADVTDATNVDAAGATMNTDTDVSANSWVLDEDDMASDSATKVPTQQSVKAYVDGLGVPSVEAGDAGKSLFVKDDETGFTLIDPVFNTPEMFGAVGDGVTDDTVAMQACWNFGIPVHLKPNSTYLVTFLRPRNGLKMVGDGTATIKQAADTDNNLIGPTHLGDGVLETVTFDHVIFDGFTLDGDKTNQTLQTSNLQRLIRGTFTNFEFKRLRCVGSVRGDIRLSNSQDGLIERCRFEESGKWLGGLNDGSAMQGVSVSGDQSRNITITRNYFKGVGAAVYATFPNYSGGVNNVAVIVENQAYGINILDNYITEISNESIQFIRWDVANPNVPDQTQRPGKSIVAFNRFEGNHVNMFAVNCGENADSVLVFGNIVRSMTDDGIKISPWGRDIAVVGNKIEDCAGAGVALLSGDPNGITDPFGALRVSDNDIQRCGSHGIASVGAAGNTLVGLVVSNNRCRNNGQSGSGSGIRLATDLTDAIISGNSCYDDQAAKTQEYGIQLAAPSGGSGTFARNTIAGNHLRNNKLGSADVIASARAGFSYIGNDEGSDPKLYAFKLDYDLNASGATTAQAIGGSGYAGRPIEVLIVPKADAGGTAFGGALATLGADAAGIPYLQVRNLATATRAVGSAYAFVH